ncbi:thiamine phosphate synthase [Candidatus Bathyarchaeota archaeon]|nr:thiamine phosphate synthase [Candidatus Bathyarchaeota archaeon]
MSKPTVDYSLYLVTDSTPAILGDRPLASVVEAALRGGVSVVQLRDKTSDTGALIATARELHALTRKFGVPLLINDRVDVALAVGCEGVHIGQDDMGSSSLSFRPLAMGELTTGPLYSWSARLSISVASEMGGKTDGAQTSPRRDAF